MKVTKEELRELFEPLLGQVREYVDQRLAAVPAGKDGAPGAPGAPGKDVDPAAVQALVEAAVAAVPRAQDGARGEPGPQGLAGIGEPGKDGKNGEPGKDGAAGKDGASVTLDQVLPVLEAGVAKWLNEVERRAVDQVQRAMDAIPRPRDGVDALGIEDLAVEHDGDGNVTLRFCRGEVTREFTLRVPCFRDRGVYSEEVKDYLRGDAVSSGGCLWLAQKDAPEGRPGATEGQWRLAVKKGRDGKDGAAPPGPPQPVKLR